MTFKFDGNGLKFGRTWVDRIMGKVDKDQGVANAGKVLGIGADGQVVPVEQSGGGSEVLFEKIDVPTTGYLYYNHNLYNSSNMVDKPIIVVARVSTYRPSITINSIDENNAVINASLDNGNGGSVPNYFTFYSGYARAYSTSTHTVSISFDGVTNARVEASTTIGEDSGYLYIKGLTRVYGQRTDSNSGGYEINASNQIYITRSSDKKLFNVNVDNFYRYEKSLSGGIEIDCIYAPPNMLSTEPFPNA